LGRPQSFVSKYQSDKRRLEPIEFVKISQLVKADPFNLLKPNGSGWRDILPRRVNRS
jgi:hypothetical protein